MWHDMSSMSSKLTNMRNEDIEIVDSGIPTNSRNANILHSMDNDYLFVLQNKYNDLQTENNTLLRNELSVLDENRRNIIKIKKSKVIFLLLLALLIVIGIIYSLLKTNLILLGVASLLIPIILLAVLIIIYKNVAYFKKHSNINVNDLNTIPRHKIEKQDINSSVSPTQPTQKQPQCYTISQSGPFNYIDPEDNKQIRDNLTTLGNINESLTKLNALKTHFKGEDKLLPQFVFGINKFFKSQIRKINKPDFDRITSIPDLDTDYNNYQQRVNKVLNNILKELGSRVYNYHTEGEKDYTTSVIFGISVSEFQKISGDKEKLAQEFLNTQKLTNYYNSFIKWINSQNDLVNEEYNKKLNSLNGIGSFDTNANDFKGHVGIPNS
jgi:hypothetical protein